MNEQLKAVLSKTHSEYSGVRYSVYRTALKLCRIQKILKLDQIEVSSALSALSQPLEGLSSSDPDQPFPDINAIGLKSVITRIFTQTQAKLGNEGVFPDALSDLSTRLIFHIYDKNNESVVSLQSVRSFFIVMCDRELIAKYKSLFWCHCEPGNKTLAKQDVARLLQNVILITSGIHEESHFENITAAVESCFSQILGYGITEYEFVRWVLLEPQSIVWLPTMHRLRTAEKSVHQVSCAVCKTRPITGMRFRCLRCLDYNICQRCFLEDVTHKRSHKSSHPIQEYVSPVKRSENLKDVARTIRNIVTKRYKSKSYTRSYLPINQSGSQTGIVQETWREQSIEMASVSLPSRHQQNLNMSRMSAGFADVSQLADEEKEKLDQLIERLDEERRRMVATTQILTSAQERRRSVDEQSSERTTPRDKATPREKERQRLKAELKDIRSYNKELEKELDELRSSLHSSEPPLTSTPRTNGHTPPIIHTPDRSRSAANYYTPPDTAPKQMHDPYSRSRSATQEEFITPETSLPNRSDPRYSVDDPRVPPRFEKLKSDRMPVGYSPTMGFDGNQGNPPKPSRSPMKVPRGRYSYEDPPVQSGGEFPSDHQKRSFRSLGSSPRSVDSDVRSTYSKGPWASRKALPDAPVVNMSNHSIQTSRGVSPVSSTRSKNSRSSKRGQSSQIFDGGSPETMLKSLSSSFSDHKANDKHDSFHNSSNSSHQRISPALREAYQRHLEATGKLVSPAASFHSNSQRSYSDSPAVMPVKQSLPPSSRRERSRHSSKSYDTDSLHSDASKRSETGRKSGSQFPKSSRDCDEALINFSSSSLNISSDSLGSKHEKHRGNFPPTKNLMDSFNSDVSRHNTRPESPFSTKPRNFVDGSSSHDFPGHARSHAHSSSPLPSKTKDLIDSYISGDPPHYVQSNYQSESPLAARTRNETENSYPDVGDLTNSSGVSSKCDQSPGSNAPHGRTRHLMDSSDTEAVPNRTRSRTTSNGSHHHTGPLVSPKTANGLMAGFDRKARPRSSSMTSHSHSSSAQVTDASDRESVQRSSRTTRRDTHGSFAAPRRASSHNNIAYVGPHVASADSLDSSNQGLEVGRRVTSDSETPKNSKSSYPKEFDPYSSEVALTDTERDPRPKPRTGKLEKTRKTAKKSPDGIRKVPHNKSKQETSSSTIQSTDHSTVSDTGLKTNSKPSTPRKPNQRSSKERSRDKSSSHDSSTREHSDSSSKLSSRHHKRSHSDATKKRSSSATSSRRSSPKINDRVPSGNSSGTSHTDMKPTESSTPKKSRDSRSSSSSDSSRSSPEGDIKSAFERSDDEPRFMSPEEEMKYLVTKLQSLMPPMFDESIDSENISSLKQTHPMTEVLLAADQTRKAIELFTEYAVAAAAGEV